MKYSVQLTSRATGTIQLLDVEAASEEEAIGRFDATTSEVKVIPPDQIAQAKQAYYDQLQNELDRAKNQAQRALPMFLLMVTLIVLLFSVTIVGLVNWDSKKSSSAPKDSEMSDSEKALMFKVLTDH